MFHKNAQNHFLDKLKKIQIYLQINPEEFELKNQILISKGLTAADAEKKAQDIYYLLKKIHAAHAVSILTGTAYGTEAYRRLRHEKKLLLEPQLFVEDENTQIFLNKKNEELEALIPYYITIDIKKIKNLDKLIFSENEFKPSAAVKI